MTNHVTREDGSGYSTGEDVDGYEWIAEVAPLGRTSRVVLRSVGPGILQVEHHYKPEQAIALGRALISHGEHAARERKKASPPTGEQG